jgi:hypothetical protein
MPSKTKNHPLRLQRQPRRPLLGEGKPREAETSPRLKADIILDDKGPKAGIRLIDEPTHSLRCVKIRQSKSWFASPPGQVTYDIPYIDRIGKLTGHTVARWCCDPRQYIASVVSTIANRLVVYARRHNKFHIVRKNFYRIVRFSFLYAVTKNNYAMDRVLFFLRDLEDRGGLIHRLMLRFLARTDENVRFVYSHVCYQAKWLLFRAKRPRDKSGTVIHKNLLTERFVNGEDRYDCIWKIANAINQL